MSEITVSGGTKKQRQLVSSIADYCIVKLGMKRLSTLNIDINLKKNLDACGYAVSFSKREFELEIQKTQSLRRLLETVAHEMVHVKQYARGELTDTHGAWKGQPVDPETEYWDLPWEIEAHGREVGLFIRWAQDNGHADKDWAQDPL